jgi:hypothetical protein
MRRKLIFSQMNSILSIFYKKRFKNYSGGKRGPGRWINKLLIHPLK